VTRRKIRWMQERTGVRDCLHLILVTTSHGKLSIIKATFRIKVEK